MKLECQLQSWDAAMGWILFREGSALSGCWGWWELHWDPCMCLQLIED